MGARGEGSGSQWQSSCWGTVSWVGDGVLGQCWCPGRGPWVAAGARYGVPVLRDGVLGQCRFLGGGPGGCLCPGWDPSSQQWGTVSSVSPGAQGGSRFPGSLRAPGNGVPSQSRCPERGSLLGTGVLGRGPYSRSRGWCPGSVLAQVPGAGAGSRWVPGAERRVPEGWGDPVGSRAGFRLVPGAAVRCGIRCARDAFQKSSWAGVDGGKWRGRGRRRL